MTIGSCAGIPLQDEADALRHGAVFLLRSQPDTSASVSLGGWTTAVAAQSKVVVTYGPSSSTGFGETHTQALRAANRGLDYMCMRGWCNAAIRIDSDDCLVWWGHRNAGVTLRARVIHTTRAQFNATATITDKSGNPMPLAPAPPTPAQHDALRFIRMARTSEYLFDAYRNMFLALERLLSDIRPRQMRPNGRPDETEKAWFTAALQQADSLVAVAKLAPAGEAAPIDWVYTNIYADERSALMHAKPGLHLLPQDDAGRAELRASLQVLWDYVRELANALLGIGHTKSGFYHSGWEYLFKPTFDNMAIFVTDTDLSADYSDEKTAEILRDNIIQLPANGATKEGSMFVTRLGAIDASDLQSLNGIHSMGAVAPMPTGGDPLSFSSELPSPITLGTSVTRFEIVAGIRNLNPEDLQSFSS